MFLKNKAADIFLKCSLALAAMISVVISSRLALKDIGDFQYNTAHKGSIGFRDFWNSTYYLFHGYNIFDPLIVQQFHLVSLYLPNSFLFFFPLVPLGPQWGKVCWLSVNLFLTVLLARQISVLFWDKKHFLILAALIACSAPWGILIYSGQFSLWSLYFFLLALQWDKENRPILSGLAIAFCLLKYALTVPLLLYFLVYRRSWKGVVLGVGIQAALFGFFCLYMNLTPWELFLGPVRVGQSLGIEYHGYLDLFVFFSRLGNPVLKGFYLPMALLVAGAWIWLLNRQRGKDDLGLFALTVMATLTISYHNVYDYLGAIFPLVWCLKKPGFKDGVILAIGGVSLWILYVSPHYLEFFPHMQPIMDFSQTNGYINFMSLLWYLGLGLLWFRLKSIGEVSTPLPEKNG